MSSRFVELFTPKLVTVLREGYNAGHFRSDLIAGLTVAIVALPLSMAIAIASGASPAQGLYTAIIGGFLISLLGGSRFQIGGPAGAFIVLVATTVAAHGMDGLLLATLMSGAMLVLIGLFRLGTYIKFIPYPVTIGFTAGIAVIIFASQIKELLGLDLSEPEPGPLAEKLPVLWQHLHEASPVTMFLAGGTIFAILAMKRLKPGWPGMLIAVVLASVTSLVLDLPVETIGSKFGGIPEGFPMPSLPDISLDKALAVFPAAVAFTLLGAIESLLSALVADSMTGRRHRSNCELVAQGLANMGSSLFGGICVTGTIARTATNVRSGAHGPIAGILHSVILLLFILLAAPLASFIPLAALAGVLAIVAWNMVEKHAFATLLRASHGDALVLLATFFLTIFRDLTEAIVVGFALGSVLFIHRMSRMTEIETGPAFVTEDQPDDSHAPDRPYNEHAANDPDIAVYRISGVFFFGAAASVGPVLDSIADSHKVLVIDFSAVPFVDSTAANSIESLAAKAARKQVRVILCGMSPAVQKSLQSHGIAAPLVQYEKDIRHAVSAARTGSQNQGSS